MNSDQTKVARHLAERALTGNRRTLARLITQIENQTAIAQAALNHLNPHTGRGHLIGITGSPGTGKSTLVTALAQAFRQHQKTVAIVAVDPTSPFSGGAILGDRVRMMALSGDSGVFIRSMANRGHLGGLAQTTDNVIKALDAVGFDLILIETVGAGQSEVEIVKTAHTILVVEAPGLGDGVQAIKAGILEIADILVVNKADRPGVEKTVAGLKTMLDLGHPAAHQTLHHGMLMQVEGISSDKGESSAWMIPIIKTIALKDEGISALVAAIEAHYQYLTISDELQSRNRIRLLNELETILQIELMRQFLRHHPEAELSTYIEQVVNRVLTPYQAVQKLLAAADRD